MKIHGFILTVALGMATTACTQQSFSAKELDSIAKQVADDVTCKSAKLEQNLWDGLKTYLLEREQLLTAQELKQAFSIQLNSKPSLQSTEKKAQILAVEKNFNALIDILLKEAPEGERVTNAGELLILLSALDVGDRSTTFRAYLQDKVRIQFLSLQAQVKTLSADCIEEIEIPSSEPELVPEEGEDDKASYSYTYHRNQAVAAGRSLAVFGSRWALATAYQSCMSVQVPDMTAQTADLQGIKITGTHSDGVGSKRMIASLSSVQSTHPYLKGLSAHDNGCFSVKSNPLIYDYGGKPYGTTSSNSTINMHKNNGSGTSVLGIDCSAYVYTSLATAGLRLQEGRALKASDSWAWGSGSYVEPQKNGLTCLSKITVTPVSNLREGDIVAVYGHVLLIEKAGNDPFGISRAKTVADCTKLTASGYDFTVAQSSPSKGGVGINFFEASAYVPTATKFEDGFKQYAYYACLAKFNNKSYTPNLGTLTISRHKGTTACMSTRVKLENESCVERCSSFNR